MSRLSMLWLVLAVLFTIGNLAFALMPMVWQEPMHGGLHVALAIVGAFLAWRLERRRRAARGVPGGAADRPGARSALSGRLTQLEHSVEAVAIEVERIGEGQRFVTRVLTGVDPVPPPGQDAVTPMAAETASTPPPAARG